MYRAVLDACVLVPSLQRDFLLQLASEEAFALAVDIPEDGEWIL